MTHSDLVQGKYMGGDTVQLDRELSDAVARAARQARKSKSAIVRAALESYLEELADYRDVVKRRKEKSIPLEKTHRRLSRRM